MFQNTVSPKICRNKKESGWTLLLHFQLYVRCKNQCIAKFILLKICISKLEKEVLRNFRNMLYLQKHDFFPKTFDCIVYFLIRSGYCHLTVNSDFTLTWLLLLTGTCNND